MKRVVLILLLIPRVIFAQQQDAGIRFETGLSWKEIRLKAKEEHKAIFMDCYATWCGPCKHMDRDIYSTKEVGDYFNAHFINIKVQMDRTSKDGKEIKAWYGDADSISQKYKVEAYPTFLFFSPEGKALHEICGASNTSLEFITKANDAFNADKQYFTLLSNLESHKEDSAFLLHALLAAKVAGDNERVRWIINDYLGCVKYPITKSNIELFDPYIAEESDKGFELYLKNALEIDQLMGNSIYAETSLVAIIFHDEIAPLFKSNKKNASLNWKVINSRIEKKYPSIEKGFLSSTLDVYFQRIINEEIHIKMKEKDGIEPAWANISDELKDRFPGYDCGHLLLDAKIHYYYDKKSWDACARATIYNIEKYRNRIKPRSVNDMIWKCVFIHSEDRNTLKKALKLMEEVVKITPDDIDDLDTYANLLYKIGHCKEAIDWEIKAIDIAKKNNKDTEELVGVLKKMQKGEPTWVDAADNS